MLRLTALSRIGGVLALVVAVIADGWLVIGQGAFGLYPAMVATVLFGVWSLLVAAQMRLGDKPGDAS